MPCNGSKAMKADVEGMKKGMIKKKVGGKGKRNKYAFGLKK